MGFQYERLGVTVDEKRRGGLEHPTGTPLLTWISRNPEQTGPATRRLTKALPVEGNWINRNLEQTAPAGRIRIAGGEKAEGATPSKPRQNATRFAAHATLLHLPDHLLHFVVTGLDMGWTEDDLRWQVLRAALSYFPLDDT